MEYLIIIAVTFLFCFILDKVFTKLFRGKTQHRSGLSVRINKHFATFGLLLTILGVVSIFSGINNAYPILWIGGTVVILLSVAMITYYMTFGVFYDEDSFVLTTFGKKSTTYHYRDIESQQLFRTGASVVIELYMKDGRAVSLQSGMTGVYPFLDHAFARWCSQKGIDPASCEFHDPENSCWFPSVEE